MDRKVVELSSKHEKLKKRRKLESGVRKRKKSEANKQPAECLAVGWRLKTWGGGGGGGGWQKNVKF